MQFENLKSEGGTISEFGGSMSALILLYLINQKGIDVFIKESLISLLQLKLESSSLKSSDFTNFVGRNLAPTTVFGFRCMTKLW